MTPDVAWTRVSDRLSQVAVTQLAIDNWHWSFVPSQVGQASREAEKRKIQAAYCHLLDHPVWPLPLILIALPEVEAELAAEGMEHIRDRCDVVTIGRMRNTDGEHANLIDGIAKLCKEAKLELSLRGDDRPMQRLTHASDEARGIAITLAKLAVLHAVRNGSSRLEIQHFRDVYASSANLPVSDSNPFVSDNWDQIDTSGIGEKVGLMDTLKSMNGPKKVVSDAR